MKKLITLLICISLITGVAAQNLSDLPDAGTTPDSIFYGLEKAFESVGLAFASNKAKKRLQLAEERLAEMQAMSDKNKSQYLDDLAKAYGENLNKSESEDVNVSETVAQATSKHLSVLDRVKEKVPEQAKQAIAKAKKNSMKGQEKALEAVSNKNPERATEIGLGSAEQRLEAAKQARSSEEVNETLQEYSQISRVAKRVAKNPQAAEKVASELTSHAQTLDEVEDTVPSEARKDVEKVKSSVVSQQVDTLRDVARENPERAAQIFSEASQARLNRANKTASENPEEANEEMQDFQKLSDFGNEISSIAQQAGKNASKANEIVAKATSRHLDVLEKVRQKVPEQARAAIENAMQVSQRGREAALNAMGKKAPSMPNRGQMPAEKINRTAQKPSRTQEQQQNASQKVEVTSGGSVQQKDPNTQGGPGK